METNDLHDILARRGNVHRASKFPPGRARLATKPSAIGSAMREKTTGIEFVAFLAARAAGVLDSNDDIDPDVRTGSCVTSIARPHGDAQLYER